MSEEAQLAASRQFLQTMAKRRTIRQYSDEPVPFELIENAIRAASLAPSGANQQPWTFVVVSDPQLKHQMRLAAEEEERRSTDEQTAKAQSPGMRSFHHPAACFELSFPLDLFGLFPTRSDMSGEAEVMKDVAHFLVIVSLVQAHPLRLLLARLGTLDHEALDSRAYELHIVAVRSLDYQTYQYSMPFRKDAAFHAALAPVGGIRTGLFPTQGSGWLIAPSIESQSQSSPHSSSNCSTPTCHSLRKTPASTHS
jgi:nitroreductase